MKLLNHVARCPKLHVLQEYIAFITNHHVMQHKNMPSRMERVNPMHKQGLSMLPCFVVCAFRM